VTSLFPFFSPLISFSLSLFLLSSVFCLISCSLCVASRRPHGRQLRLCRASQEAKPTSHSEYTSQCFLRRHSEYTLISAGKRDFPFFLFFSLFLSFSLSLFLLSSVLCLISCSLCHFVCCLSATSRKATSVMSRVTEGKTHFTFGIYFTVRF
jgi:hypothetical protein